MINKQNLIEIDPRIHTKQIQQMLSDLVKQLRDDVTQVNEPGAQALFRISAETLERLKMAYQHYDEQFDKVWQY